MAKVSTSELKGRKFGRVLVKLGKVTREQVHEALKAQQGQAGRKVGEILVDLGYITFKKFTVAGMTKADSSLTSLRFSRGQGWCPLPRRWVGEENRNKTYVLYRKRFKYVEDNR